MTNPSHELLLLIKDYVNKIAATDILSEDHTPVLFGLYGEVGSLMSVIKKTHREGEIADRDDKAKVEEFGDILWYFVALCRHKNLSLLEIVRKAAPEGQISSILSPSIRPEEAISTNFVPGIVNSPISELTRLGQAVAQLLSNPEETAEVKNLLVKIVESYFRALIAEKVSFERVVEKNWIKKSQRFLPPEKNSLPTFDDHFPLDEQLPNEFEIEIRPNNIGKTFLCWNGETIGDPMTDSIAISDGYQYHDVFHFSYAAILHWSPVMRSLINHKRKSDHKFDETQDGGRAKVVEEGLAAWIFSIARESNFFDGHDKLTFDMLKTVKEFITGFEVEQCPLYQWEQAILRGYEVFRQVKANRGGIVIGNRDSRTIDYEPFS